MSWDALAAVGSFGQFVVVLIAAFFGAQQLVALRRQNELQATLPYFAYTRSREFNAAFLILRDEALAAQPDPGLRAAIARADLADPRVAALFMLANFFNEIGVLVQEGILDAETILGFFRWQILSTWDLFVPFIAARRRAGVPGLLAAFEGLAVRARAFDDRDRFARTRRLLPPNLREAFDASVDATLAR